MAAQLPQKKNGLETILGGLSMYCHYPGCTNHATTTWSLVPVCWRHRERIMEETLKYYWLGGKTKRPEYEKIRQYTPWG